MTLKESYFAFVRENCGAPDGGTASSYRTAMDKMTMVFTANKPDWSPVVDVWTLTNPADIMALYEHVKNEQGRFRSGSGIFIPYAGRGDSYYKKGWCSAALRYFAQFRAATGCEAQFSAALASSQSGAQVARAAEAIDLGDLTGYIPDGIDPLSHEGKEIVRATKQRIGQHQFRNWLLGIYSGKCCVTGLDIPELLRASHIIPWSEDKKNRMNPSNGLCLSATYDAAFDRHLISFDEQYRMVLSRSLKDYCTERIHHEYFLAYEGKAISLPSRFLPDLDFLSKHREKLVG